MITLYTIDIDHIKLLGWGLVFLLIFMFGLVGYCLGWRAGVKAERWSHQNVYHTPQPPGGPDPLPPKWDT